MERTKRVVEVATATLLFLGLSVLALGQEDVDPEERFARATSDLERRLIARELIARGRDVDNVYYEFLLEQAEVVADSDIPNPIGAALGDRNAPPSERFGAELVRWAERQGITVEEAVELAFRDYPTRVMVLPIVDERASDVLCRCLESKNPYVVLGAISTMGRNQVTQCLDSVIKKVSNLEGNLKQMGILHLAYFKDPTAYQAARSMAIEDGDEELIRSVEEWPLEMDQPPR